MMTDEQKYAHVRLSAMVEHEWHELYPANLLRADVSLLLARLATAERRALELAQLWAKQPHYYDDCDPGQNDPFDAWHAEMDALANAVLGGERG